MNQHQGYLSLYASYLFKAIMKKASLLFFLWAIISTIYANDTINVLFVGNSNTYFNEMPKTFENLSKNQNIKIKVEQAVYGGRALRHIIGLPSFEEKVNSETWDVVVLQSDDIVAFPDMYLIEENVLQQTIQLIHRKSPGAKIYYQLMWSAQNGVNVTGEGYYTREEYFQKILTGTLYLADIKNLRISPVGQAWNTVIKQHPEINLYSTDNFHPSPEGSYLAACVMFAAIHLQSVKGNTYHAYLSDDIVTPLQNIASDIVFDNLENWNLDTNVAIAENKAEEYDIKIYPNPFSRLLNLKFKLKEPATVTVNLFSKDGELLEVLLDKQLCSGEHLFQFHNQKDYNLKKGLYIFEFKTNFMSQTNKIIFI